MKLLFSVWLVLLSIIPITEPLPSIDNAQEYFFQTVEDEYKYFMQSTELSYYNDDLDIVIVQGIYGDVPSYGVSFYSNDYIVALKTVDGFYTLPQVSKVSAMVIAVKADVTYEVVVYSQNGEEYQLPKRIILKKFIEEDLNFDILEQGNNNFKPFVKLNVYTFRLPFFKVLIIVFSSVIAVSLLGILLMFIFKKGLFDKNKRKQGVLDIKSILEAETEDSASEDIFENCEVLSVKEDEITDQTIEEPKEQIEDIKAYLQALGYVTDYNLLSEDEKNKIMLELMHLKDTEQISLKKYYEETYQLWKK
ncbi:MAG: hypothetical protein IJO27_04475 [Bacilli bacterium]|nr:hypothetical protein [Bacilli bacterium]